MHAYPAQLADFVLDYWPSERPLRFDRRALAELLSTCFQASLGREEGRTLRFRLIAAMPADVTAALGPEQFLPLELGAVEPFDAEHLGRLSPAAPYHSSMIGAGFFDAGWTIWGLLHTGADWLAPSWGGRDHHHALDLPEVHVWGPGRLGVYSGRDLVATLERGMIEATTTDVFSSRWLPELFRPSRIEPPDTVEPALNLADGALMRAIAQHMVRRALFLIRQAGNGGMILFADPELVRKCAFANDGTLKFKYSFQAGTSRERYRHLLRRLVQTLGEHGGEGPVNLERFQALEIPEVTRVEQAIFEVSSLIAGLAEVDGAVVMDKRMELVGFGAEVSGELPYPQTVWQALDVEGERRAPEPANAVGTRHRAAYRYVTAHPAGLAIVISHDGGVRFVANLGGEVVYWDQFLNW
jgi:hypothetical protein